MKKRNKYMIIAVVAMSLAACSEDDPWVVKQNTSYTIDQEYEDGDVRVSKDFDPSSILVYTTQYNKELQLVGAMDFSIVGEGISETEETVTARCNYPAPTDITVTYAITPELVDSYSASKGTDYTFMEEAELVNKTLVIKQGETESEERLAIHHTDINKLLDGRNDYLLPVSIIKIEGEGVSLSQNPSNCTFYVACHSTIKNAEQVKQASNMTGTFQGLSHPEWDVTIDGEPSSTLTDNSLLTYMQGAGTVTLDTQKAATITGLRLDFRTAAYLAQSVSISLSENGTDYMDLGEYPITKYTNGTIYFKTYITKKCQHIKLTFTDNSEPLRLCRVSIYAR